LMKWVNKDNGKVISYKYLDVIPNKTNLVSLDKKSDWIEGNYEVKVFTTQNEIRQIANTSFIVK